ncbi:MAG: multidrug effflux MFS transporter [Burkholderiaceae bacterium]
MHPSQVVFFLAILLGIQPLTTDLYLPAMPAIADSLVASAGQVQLTLTALLLAFGTSQLVWGPLSDKYGRKPILLAGLVTYTAASLGSVLAGSIDLLIAWRALQGMAMGAVVMCARAMTRDLYSPIEGARAMSKGLSGLGLIACASAPLGGLLTDWWSWRAALAVLTVFGVMAMGLVLLHFKETLARRNPLALQPATLLRTWGMILRHPTFWAYSSLTTAAYGVLFTFLASSPFVFIKVLGLSQTQYGLVMASMSATYIAGTFMCRRWLLRYGVQRTVRLAAWLTLVGGLALAGLAASKVQTVWALLVPLALCMLGHGVHQSCGQSGTVGPFPQAAGAASALAGFMMMLCAFAMGGWLGTHMDGSTRPLAYGVAFWAVLLALVAWILVQRYGEPSTH